MFTVEVTSSKLPSVKRTGRKRTGIITEARATRRRSLAMVAGTGFRSPSGNSGAEFELLITLFDRSSAVCAPLFDRGFVGRRYEDAGGNGRGRWSRGTSWGNYWWNQGIEREWEDGWKGSFTSSL